MSNGFVIDGFTPRTLAARLVEVGEGHLVLAELAKLLNTGKQTLEVKVDASAVEEAIEKEMKSLGVLGEIARYELQPCPHGSSGVDRMERTHRIVFHTQFDRVKRPIPYRDALLTLGALVLQAIQLHDREQAIHWSQP